MRVMLDTNVCIDLIRRRPDSVLDRVAAPAPADLGVSVITLSADQGPAPPVQ
jgi:predicted nucleic acid-binding protein